MDRKSRCIADIPERYEDAIVREAILLGHHDIAEQWDSSSQKIISSGKQSMPKKINLVKKANRKHKKMARRRNRSK